ncbi:MAG: AAA domain-containing protein, partial [archaeon]
DCKNSNIQEAKEIIRVLDIIIRKMKDWDQKITIAILPFYRKQERNIFDELSKYLSTHWNKSIPSKHRNTIGNIEIVLFTVDRFQGYEADITLHSMCRNSSGVGFMNVPNRINVAFSRAKSYRIIIGDRDYYDKQKKHTHLRQMISYSTVYEEGALK